MNTQKAKQIRKIRRHKRIRSKIKGTAAKPRLSVFRSNNGMFLQLIDDERSLTLASAKTSASKKNQKKSELAFVAGKELAEKAVADKISFVVFDKGPYKFHGRVKAAADGAREGGLKF
ncbi:MAG: 50S ribosomal protein L18 [Patescibacteria group bacterium]|jgi:large subunit ribosomal protein L18